VILVGGESLEYKARAKQVEDLRAEAQEIAKCRGVPVALGRVVKSGERGGDLVNVLHAAYYYEPHNREALIEQAEDLAPEVLHHLGQLEAVQKKLDPLDPRAVDRIVANVSNYMSRKWGQVSAPVFDRWIILCSTVGSMT
jgi:hypothetical protein